MGLFSFENIIPLSKFHLWRTFWRF